MRYTFTTTDEMEAARLLASKDLCHILSEFDNGLRDALKHSIPQEAGKTAESALEWARGQLMELMNDNNVDMGRIWG
jgi:hypothetical protein